MYRLSRGAAFGLLVKSYLFQGAFFQFERYDAYEDACRLRTRLVAAMQRLAGQVDFLVLPVAAGAAARAPEALAEHYAQFATTLFANVTGQPALYLPSPSGVAQAGVQLAGPKLSDARLLALGEHLLNSRRRGNP